MNGLSSLMILGIIWGAISVLLVLMIIYRAVLGIHEDNQIFLDRAEAALEQEQVETLHQISRANLFVKVLSIASGALLVVIASLWVYGGLYG